MASFLPKDYGYVILSGVAGSFAINVYLARKVGLARKEHGIQYPTVYSPSNDQFNCVQRAHLNYVETLPIFLMSAMVAGIEHPLKAAACNSIYLLGRIVFAQGYYTGDPDKRKRGSFMYAGMLGNIALSIYFALSLLEVV